MKKRKKQVKRPAETTKKRKKQVKRPAETTNLKGLEKSLSFLTDKLKKPKRGETSLRFFKNSEEKIVAFLFYGPEKIYFWGKIEGEKFKFDRSVPVKFLPSGAEEIDLGS